ncbi:MAG: hypothetical protein B7Y45_00605 [Sphingomonas sp. 28-66-16]|nr:MAG: hypothetical protein B7Y45_00605 [Sphingomonas sp. 28-66-16]
MLAAALPMTAQAMTVAEFLGKVDALKAKGFLAVGSPDIAALRTEVTGASNAYRAGLEAQIAAGRKPSSCPPPKGTAKVTSDELIAEFRTIPEVARPKTSVNAAFVAFMTRRYPCKA